MVTWTTLLLATALLVLTCATGSPGKENDSEDSKTLPGLPDVSNVLSCFGDTQKHSEQSCGQALDAVNHYGESTKMSQQVIIDLQHRSLRLQTENINCTRTMEMLSDAVAKLSLDNAHLGKQSTESELQVQTITQENFLLKERLEEKNGSVQSLTQENFYLKEQLEEKNGSVVALTQEIVDLKKQLEERDAKATVKCMLATGYQHYPGFGYYKFYSAAMSFDDAVKTCNDSGAHLGIINSDGEARVFRNIIKNYHNDKRAAWSYYFFVGLLDSHNNRQFETLDGVQLSEVGYTKWAPGQPDNYLGQENCLSITNEALLNDLTCSERTPYICEWEHV